MNKEIDEIYKRYSAKIVAIDDTPLVKVMEGGRFKMLSIEEYEEMTNKIADLEAKLADSEKENNELKDKLKWLKEEIEENFVDGQKYNELKQQLAEREGQLKSDYYKLCPRCNNPYGASQFPSKDENGKEIYVCSNCNLIETVYEPLVEQKELEAIRWEEHFNNAKMDYECLEEQLAEKDKQILELQEQSIRDNQIYNEEIAEKEKENTRLKLLLDSFDKLKQYDKDADLILINPKTCYTDGKELVVKADNQEKISFAVEQLEKVKDFLHSGYAVDNEVIEKEIDNQIKQLNRGK